MLCVSCVHSRAGSKLTVSVSWFYLFHGSLRKLQGKQRNSVTIKENLLKIVPHTDINGPLFTCFTPGTMHGTTCISYIQGIIAEI